jgi:hypothetical protein
MGSRPFSVVEAALSSPQPLVLKDQVLGASRLFAPSFTPIVIVTVCQVPRLRAFLGAIPISFR